MSFDDGREIIKETNSDTDLVGFESLWNINYQEAQDFIRYKKSKLSTKAKAEIDLLAKELEDKEFETQKLKWQLSEREKELKDLYNELHRLIELNKKLNQQLEDFENLTEKQEKVMKMLGTNPVDIKEPSLPEF